MSQSLAPPLVQAPSAADIINSMALDLLPPRVLMLLPEPVLRTATAALPPTLRVRPAARLADAMAEASRGCCGLALIDPALCEGLAREFAAYLLHRHPDCTVLAVGGDAADLFVHPQARQVPVDALTLELTGWRDIAAATSTSLAALAHSHERGGPPPHANPGAQVAEGGAASAPARVQPFVAPHAAPGGDR